MRKPRTWGPILIGVGFALCMSAAAFPDDSELPDLLLLGDYEHTYRADFAAELGSLGDSKWLVMPRYIGEDPEEDGCWFRVTERGAALSNRVPPLDDDASIPGARLRMKTIEIGGDAEVVLLIDVHELTGACNLEVQLELVAANFERYSTHLTLGDGWASASWWCTFVALHTGKGQQLEDIEYRASGPVEFRFRYHADRRAVTMYLGMIPVAEIEFPVQTGRPIQLFSLLVTAGDRQQGDLDIELVDLLLGYD